MNIKELKEFLNTLPEEYNEFEFVYRVYGDFVDNQYFVTDDDIDVAMSDENTNEIVFMTVESYDFFLKNIIDSDKTV